MVRLSNTCTNRRIIPLRRLMSLNLHLDEKRVGFFQSFDFRRLVPFFSLQSKPKTLLNSSHEFLPRRTNPRSDLLSVSSINSANMTTLPIIIIIFSQFGEHKSSWKVMTLVIIRDVFLPFPFDRSRLRSFSSYPASKDHVST